MTDNPATVMPDRQCCSHMRVVPFREEKNGVVFKTWWACDLCRLEFVPDTQADNIEKRVPDWSGDDISLGYAYGFNDGLEKRTAPPPEVLEMVAEALRHYEIQDGGHEAFVARQALQPYLRKET